jgi:hypothetical protein
MPEQSGRVPKLSPRRFSWRAHSCVPRRDSYRRLGTRQTGPRDECLPFVGRAFSRPSACRRLSSRRKRQVEPADSLEGTPLENCAKPAEHSLSYRAPLLRRLFPKGAHPVDLARGFWIAHHTSPAGRVRLSAPIQNTLFTRIEAWISKFAEVASLEQKSLQVNNTISNLKSIGIWC